MAASSPATRRRLLRTLAVLALVTTIVSEIADIASDDLLNLGLVAFPLVGLVIVWHRQDNTIGWLLVAIGTLPTSSTLAARWHPDALALAELRHVVSQGAAIGMALIPFLVVLFPSGSLPSPRWRWPARIAAGAVVAIAVVQILRTDGSHPPIRIPGIQPVLRAAVPPASLCLVLFGLAALVHAAVRTKRATGEEREQMRWFVASACVFPAIMFVNGFAQGASWQGIVLLLGFTLGLAAVAAGIGVAVLKYRLYAIDVVINKALVFGGLAGVVTAIYAVIVAGIGALVGGPGDSHLALSLVATVAVALAFQPLRDRLQRIANRLVYGTRLSPYEAVTSFTHRVSEFVAFEDVLPEMAEAAALGVGAVRSRVRLFFPHGGEETVHWPAGAAEEDFDRVWPVLDSGQAVGEIAVAKAAGDPLTAHDERLLTTLVSEAGLAMRSLRLTEELQQRLVELQESRRRLVTAQDQERRRMERDLHDGAQQQLVAMKIKLGLAKTFVTDDPDMAVTLLDDLSESSTEAIATLRDLARGLFPEVLVERGLAAALAAHITKSGLPATLEVGDGPLPRLDLQIEANVYFVLREAMQNTSKYAPGASIVVTLRCDDEGLSFSVVDDGPGFDVTTMKAGSGTQNMRDRVEALGGTLDVSSAPGRGTEIRGRVPTPGRSRHDAQSLSMPVELDSGADRPVAQRA